MTVEDGKTKKSLYVETTIPSYAAARSGANALTLLRQAQTNDFWDNERYRFKLYIGTPVIRECGRGDSVAAKKRLDKIAGIEVLPQTPQSERLANIYKDLLNIPDHAMDDCNHLAICVLNSIDFLLTWNFSHLGTATYIKARKYNDSKKLWTPILVTPETIREYFEEAI